MLRIGAGFRKALAWGLTAVLAISVAAYGIQFNTRLFAVWLYDADTKAILQAINSQTGKAQLQLSGKILVAKYPLDNVALSPTRVRFALDDFLSGVEASRKAWDFGPTEMK